MAATRADEKNDLSEDLPRLRDLEDLKPIQDLVLSRVWQALMNSNKSWSRRLSALDVLLKQKLAEREQQRQTFETMKEKYRRTIQDKDAELSRLHDKIKQLKLDLSKKSTNRNAPKFERARLAQITEEETKSDITDERKDSETKPRIEREQHSHHRAPAPRPARTRSRGSIDMDERRREAIALYNSMDPALDDDRWRECCPRS